MRNAVTPALAVDEAAMVADGFDVARGRLDERRALRRR
jgi:hypothetical protein